MAQLLTIPAPATPNGRGILLRAAPRDPGLRSREMVLRAAEYLEKAAESDRLAKEAVKPSLKGEHESWANYYRYMAEQAAKLEQARPG